MSQLRQKKIESYINAEIGKLISSKKLKDPRVDSLVTVVGVRVSKDLSFARVFISYYGDEKILNDTVEGLNHAAGYIQIIIAKNVRMRNTPKLLFVSDNSIKQGFEITRQILNKDFHNVAQDSSAKLFNNKRVCFFLSDIGIIELLEN